MNIIKSSLDKLLAKTMLVVTTNTISNFFGTVVFHKKDDVHHNIFVANLGLIVVNHLPIQIIESIWLKHFVMLQLCPHVVFPSRKTFS
jgi:hypothetical protein